MVVEQRVRSQELEDLIIDIREVIERESEPATISAQVAERLGPYLEIEHLLSEPQRESDPNAYKQHVLHVEPDGSFSIVALCWLPGQATPVHDHVSWCVVGVYEGLEYETTYDLKTLGNDEWLVETGQLSCTPGMTEALTPPGDIHKVSNAGDDLAISIHIYGADIGKLGSSILRRYDQDIRS